MSNKCSSCGHTFAENEKVCPYCGSTKNPNYKEKFNGTKTVNDFIGKVEDVFPKNETWQSESNQKSSGSEINVCLLIFLVVIFWPAAIIYVIVKMQKK